MHPTPSHPVHVPVMATRCIELLAPALERPRGSEGAEGPVVIDATLGLGGHSELLLEEFPELRLIGIDRDPRALDLAAARLRPFGDRFIPVHGVYDEIDEIAAEHAGGPVAGILMDLGVSSMQLDEPARGFAYSQDAPLDMRMDQTRGHTAADLLAELPAGEIRRILREYGDEKFASRIASRVVDRRETDPVRTSSDLVDLVRTSIPAAARRTGGNPAKRTFQALRIAVNDELTILTRAVWAAIDSLAVGGRIVALSYQSLEDRIVKRALTRAATSRTPPDFPVEIPEHAPYMTLLTRGAERAGEGEIEHNPRAAPVRLRAAEKVRTSPAARTTPRRERP